MQCVVAMMSATPTIVLENGTMLGAMSEQRKLQPQALVIPEIVISGSHSHIHSQSSSSLHRSRSRSRNDIHEEVPAESTALLEQQQQHQSHAMPTGGAEEDTEFEQFVLNRTTSESNMLESSIYSELQFSSASAVAAGANVTAPAAAASAALNASVCSRSDSRQSKRTRRKSHKSKAKCSNSNVAVGVGGGVGVGVPGVGAGNGAAAGSAAGAPPVGSYPPQYTAIFLDPHHHHHHHPGAAANALATAAAASPFLNSNPESAANFLQYHQFYQQRPMGMAHPHQHPHPHPHHHHLRR